jgi:cadmium resistance protein CadD (predicted permease)
MDIMGPMIPIIAIIMGILCAIVAMYFRHQRQKEEQETIRQAMEKGIDLPEDLFRHENGHCCRNNPLRRGIFFTAVGISLFIALYVNEDIEVAVWGLIPLAIGIGSLIYNKLSPHKSQDQKTNP